MYESNTEATIKASWKTKHLLLLPYAYSMRWCNNDCKFCYLKPIVAHKLMSLESFVSAGELQVKWLNDNINRLAYGTVVECQIIGGEIGALPNEYFDYLYEMVNKLENIVKETKVILKFSLATNLILSEKQFKNILLLHKYIEDSNYPVSIVTSFDLTGRFETQKSLATWKSNVDFLINNDYDLQIETILTKSSVQAYLSDEETVFKQTFDYILKADACRKAAVVLNEFHPYNSAIIKEVPAFEDLYAFYNKLIDKYNTSINPLIPYDLNKNVSSKPDCEFVCSISILPDDKALTEDHGAQKNHPCELTAYSLWPKNDPLKRDDIFKKKHTEEFICIHHPEIVDNFFAERYGCRTCSYYNECKKRNLRGCYQNQQFVWNNENRCIHKKIFERINNE